MGHRHRHRGQNRNQIPQRTIKPTVFGTIVILLTAAYLLVLYLIHMNYLDELIGSFIYIMLTVTALAYLPGVLTKILCSIGLSISLIYLIYVINPTLFLGICVCSAIAVVLFICFVACWSIYCTSFLLDCFGNHLNTRPNITKPPVAPCAGHLI